MAAMNSCHEPTGNNLIGGGGDIVPFHYRQGKIRAGVRADQQMVQLFSVARVVFGEIAVRPFIEDILGVLDIAFLVEREVAQYCLDGIAGPQPL